MVAPPDWEFNRVSVSENQLGTSMSSRDVQNSKTKREDALATGINLWAHRLRSKYVGVARCWRGGGVQPVVLQVTLM